MNFYNSISFEHGSLKRGERCLYRTWPAVYMGSYSEGNGMVHMLKIDEVYIDLLPVVGSEIIQVTNKDDIICKAREYPVEEGQMQLC